MLLCSHLGSCFEGDDAEMSLQCVCFVHKSGLRFAAAAAVTEEEDGDGLCWSAAGEGGLGCPDEEAPHDLSPSPASPGPGDFFMELDNAGSVEAKPGSWLQSCLVWRIEMT